jgi:hypothetical protein
MGLQCESHTSTRLVGPLIGTTLWQGSDTSSHNSRFHDSWGKGAHALGLPNGNVTEA